MATADTVTFTRRVSIYPIELRLLRGAAARADAASASSAATTAAGSAAASSSVSGAAGSSEAAPPANALNVLPCAESQPSSSSTATLMHAEVLLQTRGTPAKCVLPPSA
eukprot:CAMPEP_0183796284 /NCGR_PEP_ID=MMETSP0803_2-20130417/9773_1 /TAXON_ID=195967 /ORGANISM="Crustomastix stigmata, Strain CCMP3273" /LENGTH=108 /DNA_ID=CAMNT_0026040909 /DNA_START=282 /DNA_END=604 /DNA_ORIENTATION=-